MWICKKKTKNQQTKKTCCSSRGHRWWVQDQDVGREVGSTRVAPQSIHHAGITGFGALCLPLLWALDFKSDGVGHPFRLIVKKIKIPQAPSH